jgi:adenine phosphoribosyltransferase
MGVDVGRIAGLVRDVPDFPNPGVVFKDITPLLGDAGAFAACIEGLAAPWRDRGITKVLGIEARGFIVAAPVALALGAGFVPVRKTGKLPWRVEGEEYQLEYGTDRLEIHVDALAPGERALVLDDVLATGGTASAVVNLVRRLGAEPAGFSCLIELVFLGGRPRLGTVPTEALLRYE